MTGEKDSSRIHCIMSVAGGFIGVYALLNRNILFASAQTSNLIHIVLDLLGRSWMDLMIRLLACACYILGMALPVVIAKRGKINLQVASILIDMAVAVVLAFLPKEMNDFIALYPIFFAMAFQWNAFTGTDRYVSSSVFSTNNLRQAVLACTEYIYNRDKSQWNKAGFYINVLLSFHAGVVLAYFSFKTFGVKGSLISLAPLAVALFLVYNGIGRLSFKQRIHRTKRLFD